MLVFASEDARADLDRFEAAGLSASSFDFERQAVLPDGSKATVSFSLAFAWTPDMPKVGFFSRETSMQLPVAPYTAETHRTVSQIAMPNRIRSTSTSQSGITRRVEVVERVPTPTGWAGTRVNRCQSTPLNTRVANHTMAIDTQGESVMRTGLASGAPIPTPGRPYHFGHQHIKSNPCPSDQRKTRLPEELQAVLKLRRSPAPVSWP
jgi:hypothetical protein